MVVRTPRLPVFSTWLRAASLQAPTQRWHAMHKLGLNDKNGLESSTGLSLTGAGKLGFSTPTSRATACSSQAPFFMQLKQKFVELSPWAEMSRSTAVRRYDSTRSVAVLTTMPSHAGVVQAGTGAPWPSTSTTHTRHDPMALRCAR